MSCTLPQPEFLKTAQPADISQWLLDLDDVEEGHAAMRSLLELDATRANAVLCRVYDVICYRVGDTCFADESPPAEQDKWFVSTRVGTFEDEAAESIPLADSLEAAEQLAVERLKLIALFFGEPEKQAA